MQGSRSSFLLFTLVAACLVGGCANRLINRDTLNSSLNCPAPGCPFHIGQLNERASVPLHEDYGLVVESVRLAIPPIKESYLFKEDPSNALDISPPSISRFRFVVPKRDSSVTRTEALFVAFLLAAGQDRDNKMQNIGRDYSGQIKRAGDDPSEIRKVVRGYTRSMRIEFSVDKTFPTVFEQVRNGLCTNERESKKVLTQALIYKTDDPDEEISIGLGPDWFYSKTLAGIESNSVHTSVLSSGNDRANSLFSFAVDFPIHNEQNNQEIRVFSCESYAEIATRIGKEIKSVERSCRYAPPMDSYEKQKRIPCFDKASLNPNDNFRFVTRSSGAGSRNDIIIEPSDLAVILAAPGDKVRFGR